MEKYGFVYIWFDRNRKMFYIGSHWGTEDDGYICSSNRMRHAYRRRPQDFGKRKSLIIVHDRKELLLEEYKWLSLIKDEELGKRYYNLTKHQNGHWTTDKYKLLTLPEKISVKTKEAMARPEVREKHINNSIIQQEKYKDPKEREKVSIRTKEAMAKPEVREKMMEGLKRVSRDREMLSVNSKNMWQDPDIREKIMETRKTSIAYIERFSNMKPRSEEYKEKMRESLKNMKKIICFYCGQDFFPRNYYRWHGDKCKFK